jgi:hypothetical protein
MYLSPRNTIRCNLKENKTAAAAVALDSKSFFFIIEIITEN